MSRLMNPYTVKLTSKAYMTCLIAASGGLLFGYDLGISGGVISMYPFLKKFFPEVYEKQSSVQPSDNHQHQFCKLSDSQTLTWFTSSLYIAAIFSSVFASGITRKSGCRITMLMAGYLFAVGALFNGFAQSVWMLIFGRMFIGFGIGCANQSVPIYLSEVAPYFHSESVGQMFQMSIAFSLAIANLSNYFFAKMEGDWGWRLSLGSAIVPAIIVILGASILPDTPISLLERGHTDTAKQLLIKLRGVVDVEQEFSDLVAASEESKEANSSPWYISIVLKDKGSINLTVKHPWMNILKRKYRPQLVFAICIPTFQQLTGINVLAFYSPVLLMTLPAAFKYREAFLFSAANSGMVILPTSLAIMEDSIYRKTIWRRPWFFVGCIYMLIAHTIGVRQIMVLKLDNKELGMVILAIFMYTTGIGWFLGPIGWLVPSEIFPLEIRLVAQSINVSVNMFITFIVAQVFIPMFCHMKLGLFIFSFCIMVCVCIFVCVYLPATERVPMEDMIEAFKNHPRWRKYYEQKRSWGEWCNQQLRFFFIFYKCVHFLSVIGIRFLIF